MKIIILVDGKYNDAEHRAHNLKAGDEFETGGDYAKTLIESGFAEEAKPVLFSFLAPTPDIAVEPAPPAPEASEVETLVEPPAPAEPFPPAPETDEAATLVEPPAPVLPTLADEVSNVPVKELNSLKDLSARLPSKQATKKK